MTKPISKARDSELRRLAHELEQHLSVIRQEIRRPVEAEFAKGGLTGPQRSVMQALVNSDGRNLGELSRQVSLAHSTVSGIVDRLERRGLVSRRANPKDRRHTSIIVSKEVREFLEKKYPIIAAGPLLRVLRNAKTRERSAVVTGVRVLRRLLDDKPTSNAT